MKKLILLILVILFSSFVYAECHGGADLDINKIERTPGQSTFKVIATANRAGDCLTIAWTEDELNELLNKESPEELTDKDITGDIEIVEQKSTFNTIINDDRKIYQFDIFNKGWTMTSCSVSKCNEWGYPKTEFAIRTFSWPGPCYCIYEEDSPIATFGEFSGVKNMDGEAKISISDLNPGIIHFGNSGESIEIDNKVTVSWRGDLLGGNWIGTPEYNVLKDKNGYFRIISEDITYFTIKNEEIYANGEWGTIRECLGESEGWKVSGIEEAQNCIDSFNEKMEELTEDKTLQYVSSSDIIESANFEGSNFVVQEKPYSTRFPQFTLTFDAEWAGVHWITGQPQVTCPNNIEIDSGETKNINLQVKNIANEKGAFTLNLDCEGISSTLEKTRINLESGASEQISAQLTYSSNEDANYNCNFEAYATREPSNRDECSFSVRIIPTKISSQDINVNSNIEENEDGANFVESAPRNSSTGIIILIVILVLAGAGAGYYFYSKNKDTPKTETKETKKAKHCTKCGALLKPGSKFCTKCGNKVK